jgi:chromosome segregation ATPase
MQIEGALYLKILDEHDAHIEDRERTIGAQVSELVAYERWVNEYGATVEAQHDTIERLNLRTAAMMGNIDFLNDAMAVQKKRIAELEQHLRTANREGTEMYKRGVEREATIDRLNRENDDLRATNAQLLAHFAAA